jgi:TolB-like protein/DNA-binding winged helix-turn-helix (wHTH) protein
MATLPQSGRVRFGAFEADLSSGELRKHGVKIKLHEQPFKVLVALLEHPGEVVTREQLFHRLWPDGTFVDSDLGLNSAIRKLREALGDSAETPRFVETLPRRGYRLMVDIDGVSVPDLSAPSVPTVVMNGSPPVLAAPAVASGASGLESRASSLETNSTAAVVAPSEASPRRFARSKTASWAAIASIVIALAAGIWWFARPKPGPYTIAVLPLKNLSAVPGSDYFSDGLTDEIIRNLSIIDGLQVKSRTSSFAFKDTPRDVRAVGNQLGASLVVEGSVLRDGDRLRVDVQLVRVADDHPIWSGRYDRQMKDVFEIQDEISRSIVNELRLNLGRGKRRYNTNLEAYDLYLRAESLANRNPGVDSDEIATSIPVFELAIAKDPSFAPAYAGIADAYAYMSATPRTFPLELGYARMKEACEKAVELDPLLAEAYACVGLVRSRELQWTAAEEAFRRSIALDSNLSRPRQDFAVWVLMPLGKFDEALAQLTIASELDPLSSSVLNSKNFVLLSMGRYEDSFQESRRVLAANPDDFFAQQLMGRALLQKGRYDEGVTLFEKLGESQSFMGYAYGKAGKRDEAEKIIAAYPQWPWVEALAAAGLGDADRVFDGLEKMLNIGDPRAAMYLTFPEFSKQRGDPRMAALRSKLGLPPLK